jgi:hypothetical protein
MSSNVLHESDGENIDFFLHQGTLFQVEAWWSSSFWVFSSHPLVYHERAIHGPILEML